MHVKHFEDPKTHEPRRLYRILCDTCRAAFHFRTSFSAYGQEIELGVPEEITDTVERGSLVSFVNENRVDIALAS